MPGQKFGERIRSVKRAAGRDGGDIHRSFGGLCCSLNWCSSGSRKLQADVSLNHASCGNEKCGRGAKLGASLKRCHLLSCSARVFLILIHS
jgi:hypothetical protein